MKDKGRVGVSAKARIKKYRADQDPTKDEPYEVVELGNVEVKINDYVEVRNASN